MKGVRVLNTSAMELADFSLSLNITGYRRKLRGKQPIGGILCSENGLRSDPLKVNTYLQV